MGRIWLDAVIIPGGNRAGLGAGFQSNIPVTPAAEATRARAARKRVAAVFMVKNSCAVKAMEEKVAELLFQCRHVSRSKKKERNPIQDDCVSLKG